jgi:hypothetical protein
VLIEVFERFEVESNTEQRFCHPAPTDIEIFDLDGIGYGNVHVPSRNIALRSYEYYIVRTGMVRYLHSHWMIRTGTSVKQPL